MPCFAKVSSRKDTSIIKDWTSKYSCWWLDQISEILALHFLHFPNIQHLKLNNKIMRIKIYSRMYTVRVHRFLLILLPNYPTVDLSSSRICIYSLAAFVWKWSDLCLLLYIILLFIHQWDSLGLKTWFLHLSNVIAFFLIHVFPEPG